MEIRHGPLLRQINSADNLTTHATHSATQTRRSERGCRTMSYYLIRFTSGGDTRDLGRFANDTEAAIDAERVLAQRGYNADELVTGEWEQGRLLIWADEADAKDDAGAKALCSVERC